VMKGTLLNIWVTEINFDSWSWWLNQSVLIFHCAPVSWW